MCHPLNPIPWHEDIWVRLSPPEHNGDIGLDLSEVYVEVWRLAREMAELSEQI